MRAWLGGWALDAPCDLEYRALGAGEGEWARRGATPIEARDLGLAAASGGRLGGAQLRNTGDTGYALDWHCHDNDFHFVYVLAGSFVLELEGGAAETMEAGSAAVLPALLRHKEYGFSADFAGMMVTAPAVFDTIAGLDGELPERASLLDPGRRASVTHDLPQAYAAATRHYRHRDLGAREVTGGRIDLRIARADGSGEGNGCHYSTGSQWFMVLDGTAQIVIAGRPSRTLGQFDSMCVPAGPQATREVAPVSTDFCVINLCIPADHESIPVDRARAADAAAGYFAP